MSQERPVSVSWDNAKVHDCQIQNRQGSEFSHTSVSSEPVLSANVRDAEVQVCTELDDTDNTTVDVHEVQSQTVGMNDDLCDDYAKLQYVTVKLTDHIQSDINLAEGLCDSGAAISVDRTDVLGKLELPHIGKVRI